MKESTVEKMNNADDVKCPPIKSCKDPCNLVLEEVGVGSYSEQSERTKCPTCKCKPASINTIQHTDANQTNHTLSSTACGNTKLPCARSNDEMTYDQEMSQDFDRWGKSIHDHKAATTNDVLKPKLTKRCPDVACEYPCYIYKVTVGDCPRCSCPASKDSQNESAANKKIQKFVTSNGLVIQDGN